jgi:hypothetical protein
MSEVTHPTGPAAAAHHTPGLPTVVDRAAWQAEIDALRVREKAVRRIRTKYRVEAPLDTNTGALQA